MSGRRSFVCLICGRTVTVSSEEYILLKENPICDECKNAQSLKEDKNSQPDDVLDTALQLTKKVVRVVSKAIGSNEIKSSTTVNKTTKQSVLKNVFNTAISALNTDNTLPEDKSVFKTAKWQHIGCLGELYDAGKLSAWSHCVGLYMHKIDGKIMYIGRAVEYDNGGFRKRLSDYCRANGSARKHPSGQKIYANRYRIQTHILIVGNDAVAAEKSKRLEELFVGKYNPPWNSKLKTSD